MGRDKGGGPGPGRRLRWVRVGVVFSATPLGDLTPYHIALGPSGVPSERRPPPPSGRKWSPGARGGLRSGFLSHFFFSSRESGALFPTPERSGNAGWGGQFPSDPRQLGGLTYKVSAPELKGTPGGGPPPPPCPRPGVGSAGQPALWWGSPGKAPPPRSVPPRHKSGRRKRGERAFVNSNVRRPTPGGGFVNNLPFLVARAGGVAPPPPCKSVAFQEAFEIRTGVFVVLFLLFLRFFFSHFLRAAPLPTLLAPSPAFCPTPPPLPFVE